MVKYLNLTVINDNVGSKGLKNEWGWSILIQSEKWNILFDADTSPDVIEYNTREMGIDLKNLNYGFLSHYHKDHYGGFEYVGKIKDLKVFVPPRNTQLLENWGLVPQEVEEPMQILEDVWSTGPMGFVREQAMGIKVNSIGLVVVVGCSHPGVDSMAYKLKNISEEEIFLVIGGFHNPSKRRLDNLAALSRYISPAHCSGEEAKRYVKKKYPSKYFEVRTGSRVRLPP